MPASPSCPTPCHFLRRLPCFSERRLLRLFSTLPVSHALQRSSVSIGPIQHLITRTHLGRYDPFPSASLCVPFALPDLAPDRTCAQSTTSGFCPAPLGVSSPFSSVSFLTCFLVPLVPSDFHCTSPAQPTRTLPRQTPVAESATPCGFQLLGGLREGS